MTNERKGVIMGGESITCACECWNGIVMVPIEREIREGIHDAFYHVDWGPYYWIIDKTQFIVSINKYNYITNWDFKLYIG